MGQIWGHSDLTTLATAVADTETSKTTSRVRAQETERGIICLPSTLKGNINVSQAKEQKAWWRAEQSVSDSETRYENVYCKS